MMNWQVAVERLGDEELLRQVGQLCLEGWAQLIDEIGAAVEQGNAARLERAAHTLKGQVSNFNSPAMFEAALALEMIGRHGDLSGAAAARLHLERQYAAFEAALRQYL